MDEKGGRLMALVGKAQLVEGHRTIELPRGAECVHAPNPGKNLRPSHRPGCWQQPGERPRCKGSHERS